MDETLTWLSFSWTRWWDVASGKLTVRYRKSPCYQWVNPLFRLGHVQVRKLSTYQRALFFLVELQRSQTFKRNGAFDRNVSNRSHDWFYLSVDVFLNEAFQSFVDLTTWMFFVNCQAYVVSFYFGVELHWTQAGFFHFWAWKVRRHYDQGHAFISHDKRRRLFRPNDGRAATRIHVCKNFATM